MRKIDINALIQLLGIVGIIGSLVFVGLEMRQSQRIAEAAQQQQRSSDAMAMINTLNEIEADWQSIVWERNPNYGDLYTRNEVIQRNLFHLGLYLVENDYYQYSRGLMNEDVWMAKITTNLEAITALCFLKPLLHTRLPSFPAELQSIFGEFPDACPQG